MIRVLKWLPGILVLLVLFLFYGFVPYFLSSIGTVNRFHFHDPLDGNTPQSFGMKYADAEFTTRDGVDLKGWYVPAAPGAAAKGTVVLIHGLNRSRVEMLPEAQFAHGLGYDVLLFDLRHQGASGGKFSSLGYWERLDAEAAVNYALQKQDAPQPVVLWGVSMGAAAALMAAAETPSVAAVISDSTFLSLADTVHHHYYLFRGFIRRRWKWFPPLPGFPLVQEVTALMGWRAHFDPAQLDLRQAVEKIDPRPILFVAVSGDPRMPPSIAQQLDKLAQNSADRVVVLPGKRHGEGFNEARQPYEAAVTQFLNAISSSTTASPNASPAAGKQSANLPAGGEITASLARRNARKSRTGAGQPLASVARGAGPLYAN